MFLTNQKYLGYACIIFSIVLLRHKTRRFNAIKKSITKKMEIEFPVWLREVSLSLENLTVLNAIYTM